MSASAGAIRRLKQELKEIKKHPSKYWTAEPVNDDLFEWHYTIKGPPGTDFTKGIYHGRIVFPLNYPMAPPQIMLLTPNGRFEIGKKICLSMSNFHPELWQPAWGIRTMVEALRSFFPSPPEGAVGSLNYPSDVRQKIAKNETREWKCLVCEKTNLELLPECDDDEEEPMVCETVPAGPAKKKDESKEPVVQPSEGPLKTEEEGAKTVTVEKSSTDSQDDVDESGWITVKSPNASSEVTVERGNLNKDGLNALTEVQTAQESKSGAESSKSGSKSSESSKSGAESSSGAITNGSSAVTTSLQASEDSKSKSTSHSLSDKTSELPVTKDSLKPPVLEQSSESKPKDSNVKSEKVPVTRVTSSKPPDKKTAAKLLIKSQETTTSTLSKLFKLSPQFLLKYKKDKEKYENIDTKTLFASLKEHDPTQEIENKFKECNTVNDKINMLCNQITKLRPETNKFSVSETRWAWVLDFILIGLFFSMFYQMYHMSGNGNYPGNIALNNM